MRLRLNRLPPITTAFLACLVAYILYYATLPVPEDMDTIDRWTIRVIATGIDLARLSERWGTPFRDFGFNFIFSLLGAWGIRNVMYNDTFVYGVKVRIYEPVDKPHGPMPGIVYLHGGGWVYGNTGSYHGLTGYLASQLQIVLISVDYRNPPSHLFPAAIDDATTATVWFLRHAKEYNVDTRRIALVGDSCGGNLAAAVAQRLTFQDKYKNLPRLKFQGLIYPVLQAFDFNLPSYQQNGDNPALILLKVMMVEFWSIYMLGNHSLVHHFWSNNHTSAAAKSNSFASKIVSPALIPQTFKYEPYTPTYDGNYGNEVVYSQIENTILDPDFAPLMRENLTGLPSSYILTVEHGLLRDEGILYMQRLKDAGVEVTWKHYKHGIHGIFSAFAVPGLSLAAGRECMTDFLSYTREQFCLVENCKM